MKITARSVNVVLNSIVRPNGITPIDEAVNRMGLERAELTKVCQCIAECANGLPYYWRTPYCPPGAAHLYAEYARAVDNPYMMEQFPKEEAPCSPCLP